MNPTPRSEAASRPEIGAPQVRRRLVAKSLLVLGGLAFALSLAEIGLRISGYSHFDPYALDPEVGFSLRPNAEGWWRKEGVTYVRINSHGFRDREHSFAKPPNTIRIAVLGDSFAEALQVPMEKTFWALMESDLQACAPPGFKIEVLNFGVSGFSTARELILLRQRVWQYSPDVILLLVTPRNDIRDNSSTLDVFRTSGLPHFVYREGVLTLDDSRLKKRNSSFAFRLKRSFVGKSFNWLRRHSRLMELLDAGREAYQLREEPTKTQTSSEEPGLDDAALRPPVNEEWNDAWKITEGLIVMMRDEVNAKGARFLVVTGSSGIQVSPDASLRSAYLKRIGSDTLFYPELRIKTLGEQDNFEVLNLAPSLLDYAIRNRAFLHGSGETAGRGHWNETGHRVVAGLIAPKLCEAGFLGSPGPVAAKTSQTR